MGGMVKVHHAVPIPAGICISVVAVVAAVAAGLPAVRKYNAVNCGFQQAGRPIA